MKLTKIFHQKPWHCMDQITPLPENKSKLKIKPHWSRERGSLTRVQGSNGSVVVEVAAIIGHAMLEEIVIESIRRRILHTVGVVAGPSVLDWAAIGPTSPAGPVQRRLQRCVLRVVLRHAPQLLPRTAAAARAAAKRRKHQEKKEGKARRKNEAFSSGHSRINGLGCCG